MKKINLTLAELNLVRSTKVMKKHYNYEWHFYLQDKDQTLFATISKNDNLYYLHYNGRTTPLKGYNSYMTAVKKVAILYKKLSIAGGCTE